MMRFSTGLKLVALSAVLALAACTSKPAATPDTAPPAEPQQQAAPVQSSSIVPWQRRRLARQCRDTVHFDYNKYEIMDADHTVLQRQSA